jgi:hypothetical protein
VAETSIHFLWRLLSSREELSSSDRRSSAPITHRVSPPAPPDIAALRKGTSQKPSRFEIDAPEYLSVIVRDLSHMETV